MSDIEIPSVILAAIGPVLRLSKGAQGMTSTLVIAETAGGRFAIKHSSGVLYSGWLAREYRALTALAESGLAVPHPRAFTRDDNGIVPQCWLAMDYLPGIPIAVALAAEHSSARRANLLYAFGSALNAIHRTIPPVALPRYNAGWLEYMLEEAGENLEHFNVDGSPQLLARLRQTRPEAVTESLIHGDYTIDNVLVDGDVVTGVIDWAGGAVGDPRYDIALAIRQQAEAFGAEHTGDLDAFFEGYGARALSQKEFDYFNGLYEFF